MEGGKNTKEVKEVERRKGETDIEDKENTQEVQRRQGETKIEDKEYTKEVQRRKGKNQKIPNKKRKT